MYFEHIGDGINANSISKEEEISLNKRMSRIMLKVRSAIKPSVCMYCGKPVTSLCNSHCIPRFCLENIGSSGHVAGPNAIFNLPSMGVPVGKKEVGLKEAGTFHLLCRECDSMIFQDYENPDNYVVETPPTQKMLAEIAMKNYLKFISKRRMEIELYKFLIDQHKLRPMELKEILAKLDVSILDLEAYTKNYERAKRLSKKDNGYGYYVIYYRLLDYIAPIAIQSPIALYTDLENNIVNDVLNMDAKYIPSDMHLCVFPLKSKTAIILFIEDGDKKYRKFYKQFRKCPEEEKLGIINYLIFLYCEDYFLADDLQKFSYSEELKKTASLLPVAWSERPLTTKETYATPFSLSKWKDVENFLSETHKMN